MESIVKLPQLAWDGVRDLELEFPQGWNVETCAVGGRSRAELTDGEIEDRIRQPVAGLRLRELARGRKQAVIIFDDLARPTRAARIVPHILREIREAGIEERNIRFVCALGCHGAISRQDFAKKLGEDIVRRFPVYNHNAFGLCVKLGTTSQGVEISANGEVMRCDLKIAIGTVAPHPIAGFGGGEKIVLPGICSFETNAAFHRAGAEAVHRATGKAGRGQTENNPYRANMVEACTMVGLDFDVETISGERGEVVAVYAGAPSDAYAAGVSDASRHYLTHLCHDKDVVIANAFHKASEPGFGCELGYQSIREGGDVVLVANSPGGHVSHYLFGSWGNDCHASQVRHGPPPHVNHLYVLTEFPDLAFLNGFSEPEKVSILTNWTDVLAELQERHQGNVKVGVYPNADVQYSR